MTRNLSQAVKLAEQERTRHQKKPHHAPHVRPGNSTSYPLTPRTSASSARKETTFRPQRQYVPSASLENTNTQIPKRQQRVNFVSLVHIFTTIIHSVNLALLGDSKSPTRSPPPVVSRVLRAKNFQAQPRYAKIVLLDSIK